MARKYDERDFRAMPKPRITRVNKQYGLVVYTYMCACSSGSRGYGTTPGHAYARWFNNWWRRRKWYRRYSDQPGSP